MKVKMTRDLPRTIDGDRIGPFSAGREYELEDGLAQRFIDSALAEQIAPSVVEEPAAEGSAGA